MSRRKQENPQPRKRLLNADAELLQDTLTCGSCAKVFALSEIVKFIHHKIHACNKENSFLLLRPPDDLPPATPRTTPSISAPIKGLHRNTAASPQENGQAFFAKREGDECPRRVSGQPIIKQELKEPPQLSRSSPKIMVNAYTNTIITEPSTYTCSTCKQTFTSAWVLCQHAQHMHGMKIYLVTPYRSEHRNHQHHHPHQPPPQLQLNSNLGLPPVLPPALNGPLSLENHPALQLLRMPLGERHFPPPGTLFPRPPSQDFRVDVLATSAAGHLNHHLPPTSMPMGYEPPPHGHPFGGLESRPRPPPMSLNFEPQMDFYSQRLRQLAGASSPTPPAAPAASSPRKTSPPFSHPPPSQPSTPSSTPQPPPIVALNLHSSPPQPPSSVAPHPRGSSASSTGSSNNGKAVTLAQCEDDSKLLKAWPCDFCNKSFRFQSSLDVHRRTHTGERPYKCPICRHSCAQASKLKRHMRTHHRGMNGTTDSPRSTPDSTSEAPRNLDEEGSDGGQTADNEDEEEDLEDDEDEEDLDEDEMDEEEDLDDSMMAEDLSTRGPNSSTPLPRSSPCSENHHKRASPKEDANNDNSSNTVSISNGEHNGEKESPRPQHRHSLLGEVMDKIGLSNIQQYNEAYQKALEESSLKNSSKDGRDSSSRGNTPVTENGPLNNHHHPHHHHNHEDGEIGGKRSKSLSLHPLEFGQGLFAGAFGEYPFGGGKRLKADRDYPPGSLWLGEGGKHSSSGGAGTSPLCGKASAKESAAAAAQRRNDTCEYCGKVFKNCSNLTVHRRSHTGEKPYKCELCSYACAQSSKLTRHMKTHGRLGKDVYRCRFCDMPFSVPSTLEKHMRKCVVVNQNSTGVPYMDSDSKEHLT